MATVLIRIEDEPSDEVMSALPGLLARCQRASTTLVGDVGDQEGVEALLSLLTALEISVNELVMIPDRPSTDPGSKEEPRTSHTGLP